MFEREELKKYNLREDQIEAIVNAEESDKVSKFENAIVANNTSKIYSGLESKATEIYGIQKQNGEKATDMFVRGAKEHNEKALGEVNTELKSWQDKYKELEKNGIKDEELKQKLEAAQSEISKFPSLLQEKDNEWKTKYDAEIDRMNTLRFDATIDRAWPKLENQDDEYIAFRKQKIKDEIKNNYETNYDEQGNAHFMKGYQNYKIEDIINEGVKDLIEGQGGKKSKPGENSNTDFSTAKNLQEAREMLIEKYQKSGKQTTTAEFATELDEVKNKYNLKLE